MKYLAVLFALPSGFMFSATAIAAPQQLFNKSVELFWGETWMSKRVSDGTPSTGVGRQVRTIYISSAGRVFVKRAFSDGPHSGTRERGPEATQANVSFSGSTLTMVGNNQEVARRVVVSFDPSFSSCTASVTIGKTSANAKMIGTDGAVYAMQTFSAGAVSCSIKQGNALASQ